MSAGEKRKLKLQVQMTVDGFVGGQKGEMDWTNRNWDNKIMNYVNELTGSVDAILLGRKMAEGFMSYWTSVKPESPEYTFARKMLDKPKFVFTKSLDKCDWINTKLVKGDLTEEVNNLKQQPGKSIIVYGGATFVSSLIQNNLIDEYHLFSNPAAIGKGISIFKEINKNFNLKLVKSLAFDCGIVMNHYEPVN